ncbi:MAG: PCRF domain-containing protein, partial [Limnochordales bacterium]
MFDRLAELERRYEELGQRMTDPEVLQDPGQLQKVAKAHAELEEIVSRWRAYRQVQEELAET